jgi:transcriptional regulator with XRE-family HTH domain
MTINQRLKILRKRLHLSQIEFSELIGITQATLSRLEHGVNTPSMDVLFKIASKTQASLDWLVLGVNVPYDDYIIKNETEGHVVKEPSKIYNDKNPIFINEGLPKGLPKGLPNQKSIDLGNPNCVPLMDQRACAGTPGGFADVSHEEDRHIYLPDLPSSKSVIGITVSGDSMDPTLMQGDIIVCAKCDKPNQINKLSVYVICIAGEGASVKRYRSQDDDALYFSSDNRSYGNLIVPKSDIVELWEVMYRITPRIENPETDLLHRVDDLEANIVEIKQMLKGVKTGKKG